MAITINGTTGISGVDGSAGTPALQGSDPNTGIYSPGANQVAVATNGVGRLFVDASGGLQQYRDGSGTTALFEATGNSTVEISRASSVSTPGSARLLVSAYGRLGIESDDHITFSTGTQGASIAERLRITSAGLVGIGTSSPAYKCDIDVTGSALRLNSTTTGAALVISSDDAANAKIEFGDESDNDRGAITYDNPNNALIFQANAAERLRIANTGALGLSGANYGSSGQVLTSQGSGSAPQWATVSQGYTWLSAAAASGSSVTITGISTSATDILIGVTGVSGTSSGHLKARVGNGSIDSGSGNYQGGAGGTDLKTFSSSSTEFIFTPSGYTGATHTWSGHIRLTYVTGNSWAMSSVLGTTIDSPVLSGGRYINSAGLDRIQFYFPSGNFDAGTFRVGYIV
jgi:hypothetical protein